MLCNDPIFIVGPVRSGTTLVRSVLNSTGELGIPRETCFFQFLNDSKFHQGNDKLRFWRKYTNHRRFLYQDISREKVDELIKNRGNISFKMMLDSLMEVYLMKTGKLRWGEKTPGHELFLKQILQWYP